MSYDIELIDKNTKKTISMNRPQFVRSGTVPAAFDATTGKLVQIAQCDASINITYNYSHYFYEATENDERFAHIDYNNEVDYGIRGLYNKSAQESISMLKDMISRITKKYTDDKGNWLVTKRTKYRYFDKQGNEIKDPITSIINRDEYISKEETYNVSEGDTSNYWEATAANAIESLWNMIFIATDQLMNENAIWDGD